MSRDEERALLDDLYKLDCKKYGPLPRPVGIRKNSDNKHVAVYPDHTFPRQPKLKL
jgi:hypothetical protein